MARVHAARRSRPVSTYACLYRGQGDTETEIEVEVCGLVEPYFAGDYHEPASGGEVDGVQAVFIDGKKRREIVISDDEVQELSEKLIESTIDCEPEDDRYDGDDCEQDDFD